MEITQPDGSFLSKDHDARPRVQVSSPGDVLAVVPHLLGFHPDRSFVVIGAGGPRARVELGFRYDLPDPPSPAVATEIVKHAVTVLVHRRLSTAIAVGYGPGRLVTPVADAFAAAVRRGRLQLRELLRVEDGRYWSYLCATLDCCPAEGVPFDYRSHPAAAAMTAAGLAVYTGRETLAQTIAPVTGAAARAMASAIERAGERTATLVTQAQRQGSLNPLRLVIDEGRRAIRLAIGTYREGGRITDEDKLAWLIVSLVNLAVRDDAWARMLVRHRVAHLRLWADLVRHASGRWVPAPAALLAFTAWQSGNGALANIALERALAADPSYSMALLLREILDAGVPPSQANPPMTPEQVAESYARAQSPAPRRAAVRGRTRRERGTGSPGRGS